MKIKGLEEYLSTHPFCEGFDAETIRTLSGCARNAVFQRGEYIFRRDEPANEFFLVRRGQVALELVHPTRDRITLQTLGEGDVLGWSWLFEPYAWFSDCRTTELTRVVALNGSCLRTKCENDRDLGFKVMTRVSKLIIDRLRACRLQILDMYAAPEGGAWTRR